MKNTINVKFQDLHPMQIGIKEKNLKEISEKLCEVLSSNYFLFLKTQKFHWNSKGQEFFFLHRFFEETYEGLLKIIDEIAERISMLGFIVPGSLQEFNKLTKIKESSNEITEAPRMILDLINDLELLIKSHRELIEDIQEFKDDVTLDLLTDHLKFYEKTNWILRNLSYSKDSQIREDYNH